MITVYTCSIPKVAFPNNQDLVNNFSVDIISCGNKIKTLLNSYIINFGYQPCPSANRNPNLNNTIMVTLMHGIDSKLEWNIHRLTGIPKLYLHDHCLYLQYSQSGFSQ